MKHSPRVSSLLGAALLLAASACSSKPDEQKELAQKAMEQAKEQPRRRGIVYPRRISFYSQ